MLSLVDSRLFSLHHVSLPLSLRWVWDTESRSQERAFEEGLGVGAICNVFSVNTDYIECASLRSDWFWNTHTVTRSEKKRSVLVRTVTKRLGVGRHSQRQSKGEG